jgi:hypothetical protein
MVGPLGREDEGVFADFMVDPLEDAGQERRSRLHWSQYMCQLCGILPI